MTKSICNKYFKHKNKTLIKKKMITFLTKNLYFCPPYLRYFIFMWCYEFNSHKTNNIQGLLCTSSGVRFLIHRMRLDYIFKIDLHTHTSNISLSTLSILI